MSSREYNPNKWLITKFVSKTDTWYKVFGSWAGGYLDGDSWRLSSGLESIKEKGEYYLMKNYSGSIYKCHKDMRGIAGAYNMAEFSFLVEKGKEHDVEVSEISLEEFLNRKVEK